ncbi:MAG: AEC family transporter [Deltaproteobacteria bacterium]|nr:AEC family transporter [Deltaproteobacteria bacterium]
MNQIFLLIFCYLLGLLCQRFSKFPRETSTVLNHLIIYLCLPAVILLQIRPLQLNSSLWFPMLTSWFLFFAGALFFFILSKFYKFSKQTFACLMLVAGMGNTAFVGFPMIEAFYGKDALQVGILVDEVGTFFLFSTVAMAVAIYYSSGQIHWPTLFKRMFFFPSFLAFIVGMLTRSIEYPKELLFILQRIADMLPVLALFSVGFQMKINQIRPHRTPFLWGLFYKLIFGPILLGFVGYFFFKGDVQVLRVSLFEAAMPPMISAGILAMEHQLDSDLAVLLVGIGIPISFLTLPVVHWILLHFN